MPFLEEYTMLDELGKGSYATVYKVRHNELGYVRAVRVLNDIITDENSKVYQNFLRECKTLLQLGNGNHPNIVHIRQPKCLGNRALVEMDYVDGLNVFEYLEQNHNYIPVEEVIRMAVQISSALAYCHEDIYKFCMDRGEDNLIDDPNDGSRVLMDEATHKRLIEKYKVIHNDIHSGNIMRREDGNYILLDFGLAINGDEVVRASSSRRTNGAPEFKAPEKWTDESVLSEKTDIYSFGIVLFQCLAGRVPFPFDINRSNKIEAEYMLSKAHMEANPPSIETLRKEYYEKKCEGREYEKDYPQWLEDVILKCLQKDPADRYRNGKELYEDIVKQVENKLGVKSQVLLEQKEKLQKDLEQAKDNNDVLRSENNELKNDIEVNKKLIDQLQIVLNKRSKAIKWLVAFLVVAIMGSIYANIILNRQTQAPESNGDVQQLEETINSLEKQIAEKDKKIEDVEVEIAELRKKNPNANEEIKRLNAIVAQKEQDVENVKKQLAKELNVKSDLEMKLRQMGSLQDQLTQSRNNAKKTEIELAAKSQQIKTLNAQLESNKKEIENLKKQLTATKPTTGNNAEIDGLTARIASLEADLAKSNRRLGEANKSKARLEESLKAANIEIDILKEQLGIKKIKK